MKRYIRLLKTETGIVREAFFENELETFGLSGKPNVFPEEELPITQYDTLTVDVDEEGNVTPRSKEDIEAEDKAFIKRMEDSKIQAEISRLKEELSASDYKITKCYEASLLGAALPYDIEGLHFFRQTARDRINELETLL